MKIKFYIWEDAKIPKWQTLIIYMVLILFGLSLIAVLLDIFKTIASIILITIMVSLVLSTFFLFKYSYEKETDEYVLFEEERIFINLKNMTRDIKLTGINLLSVVYDGYCGESYFVGNRLNYKNGLFKLKIRLKNEDILLTLISKSDYDAKRLKDYFFSVLGDYVPYHLKLYEKNYDNTLL